MKVALIIKAIPTLYKHYQVESIINQKQLQGYSYQTFAFIRLSISAISLT